MKSFSKRWTWQRWHCRHTSIILSGWWLFSLEGSQSSTVQHSHCHEALCQYLTLRGRRWFSVLPNLSLLRGIAMVSFWIIRKTKLSLAVTVIEWISFYNIWTYQLILHILFSFSVEFLVAGSNWVSAVWILNINLINNVLLYHHCVLQSIENHHYSRHEQ